MLFKYLSISALAVSTAQAAIGASDAAQSLANLSQIAAQTQAFADETNTTNYNQTGANISEYLGTAYIRTQTFAESLSDGDAPAYSESDQVLVTNAWTAYVSAEEALLTSLNAKREFFAGFVLPIRFFTGSLQGFSDSAAAGLLVVAPSHQDALQTSKGELYNAYAETIDKYQTPSDV
ncbi:hypothetical protein PT974_12439 [Cladobotryum mycophilum]|uniref:Uncharacterized protein n=1 Tax=Cladobotryum mycophilum TaxID=491253 RepID=A0ABR0S945_9HYPO